MKKFINAVRSLQGVATAKRWDKEYTAGKWDYLLSLDELAHYSVLAGYARFYNTSSVLDIGCGHGALLRLLPRLERYVGIDISEAALTAAKVHAEEAPGYTLLQADFDFYTPDEAFDLVVLNEVLYYSKAPLELLRKSLELLESGGVVAISMFDNARARKIWKDIDVEFGSLSAVDISNGNNAWRCVLISNK